MSSDEEDVDLNEDSTTQIDNASEDGTDMMDTDDPMPSTDTQQPSTVDDTVQKRVLPKMQLHANTCKSYNIVPVGAAIHPNPIYSIAATRCFRWVLTGSEDGYIRKWDFFASMNGKTMLTQVQRHQLVDSITKAGYLASWWENEEQPEPKLKAEPSETSEATPAPEQKLSPVYSVDIQSDGLWALSGLENGSINLVTVRHDEGKCHHVFWKHAAPVSVLSIMPGERSFISGSWDKTIVEWDLDTGSVQREYGGYTSQISSISFRPLEKEPVTTNAGEDMEQDASDKEETSASQQDATDANSETEETKPEPSGPEPLSKDPNIMLTTSIDGTCLLWDRREPAEASRRLNLPDKTPPWCLSACWSADGSKIYTGRRNGTVDEYDFAAQKLIRSFRMPANSGPVSCVASLPNGSHIICASNDNIRMWNTSIDSTFTIQPGDDGGFVKPTKLSSIIPFTILPGHHGAVISNILIDRTSKYMITTSGTRGWEGTSNNGCLLYDIQPVV
ncbi:hypothetical protein K450DRAFT_240027 [Umbelopsis ramanniana AG]|uniref:Transcription factor spt8 beta-propeller domain-containing protein n=1 Tax=Umbelopsis ramanniana AG TaxID=1314678 RepID=A0AAD5EAT1_UMBRA|nr:uncharacterized protein K450DRAFT_240027 [Umbelopsis ramanniana AG]KAI8579982.1 hypothetical protein K450DRAFT_240027 [Umbelopsis ramanniana AG]